ncbi:PH domain-containing protein [Lysinibacter cavernae]|uniref:Membrane protein YdbS with pleckstrin-like domain n=1 Tax=Lysinibacter cavernae TaxID=1640652 RepID=A0A7X5R3X6_9MICO|nr:PH domain-containing protein [Lysinibacter cavernae]NIH55121.1 membrane protein YdbS with pleckstrin-like domain [Lysinibacter cavernae]
MTSPAHPAQPRYPAPGQTRAGEAAPHTSDLDAALRPATAAHVRPEIIIARLRRHGRRLTFPVIMLLVIAPMAGYFGSSLSEPWQRLTVIVGALLLSIIAVVLPYFAWLGTTFTVTTKRVIVRHGFLVRSRSEASIGRIREVRMRQTAVQRMHRSGTVQLMVGSDAPLELVDVPGAETIVSMLHELIERSYAVEDSLPQTQPSAGYTTAFHPAQHP